MSVSSRDASPMARDRRHAPETTDVPPPFNKCFVVSALMVFLAMAWTSAPNLISGNNSRASANRIQREFQQKHDAARFSKLPSHQGSVPSPPPPPLVPQPPLVPEAQQKLSLESLSQMSPEEALAAISAMVSVSGLTASATTSEAAMSTITSSSSVAHTQKSARQGGKDDADARKAEKVTQNGEVWKVIWALIRYVASVMWRVCLAVHWFVRFLVSKPYRAVMVVMEPPWMMLKDMYKAFLPVYSFFTMAAIIGVVVGGVATWIGQLLISAIGASGSSEDQTQQQHHQPTIMEMQQERNMRSQYRMQTRRL